jgi:CubicO group peptidase (beta-lactamase class C family)
VPWTPETLVLIWSATKGLAAACVLRALDQADLALDAPVAAFWPEFSGGGKGAVTVGAVLSHAAGLGALREKDVSLFDHAAVAAALADQVPFEEAVGRPGYGPRTSGFLMDEIVRRLSGGQTLGDYWRTEFADPMDLDLWIGLPAEEESRVATILAPRGSGDPSDPFLKAFMDPASLTRRAFSAPVGLAAMSAANRSEVRRASIPSLSGIGTASALAKFYSMLANDGRSNGVRLIGERPLWWAGTPLSQGLDAVLCHDVAFSAGFMMDPVDEAGKKQRFTMGPSVGAFGHPGAGGSLAFADPENGIGFAYVMNQMEPGVLPGARAGSLVRALYGLDARSSA